MANLRSGIWRLIPPKPIITLGYHKTKLLFVITYPPQSNNKVNNHNLRIYGRTPPPPLNLPTVIVKFLALIRQ